MLFTWDLKGTVVTYGTLFFTANIFGGAEFDFPPIDFYLMVLVRIYFYLTISINFYSTQT